MLETGWTDEQVEAITAPSHVLLTASAGTGKTTTIVGKVLWLLGLDVGVRASTGEPLPPCSEPCTLEEIAAITFTEKAAFDLKGKLRREIERSSQGAALRWEMGRASVGTIHGFCAELLRDHALRLGIDPTFRVLDERETRLQQDQIIRDTLIELLGAKDPGAIDLVQRFHLYRLQHREGAIDRISAVLRDVRWRARRYERWMEAGRLDTDGLRGVAESAGIWSEDEAGASFDIESLELAASLHTIARRVLRRWLDWLESENVRDFDSLILDARRLLTRPATRPALDAIRARYRILIIDEFQDTDDAQRDIAFAIAGLVHGAAPENEADLSDEVAPANGESTSGPPVFLVGDPKQSIYRFRGADISVWNSVRQTIASRGRTLELTHNFRSQPLVVDFVNRVCGRALGERAAAIAEESPDSIVGYGDLEPARHPTRAAGLEWLVNDGGTRKEWSEEEGRMVASHIQRLVGRAQVVDPDTREPRICERRDVAIIARTRRALSGIEPALRLYEIPYYNTATAGLSERQEVLDLVTVLRILDNPRDDRHVFAFLRSPFVGLRDEVLARIRLDPAVGRGSFLEQAERYLAGVAAGDLEWFESPESSHIACIEREALQAGLRVLEGARLLVDRVDTSELLEQILQETDYRVHLLLRDGAAESLANIERFLAVVEDYRHLPLGNLLALWDQWASEDLGIPQAPLFSKDDDVVTLSTIHTAKGLEWPVVFLVATREGETTERFFSQKFWSDPRYGPVFMGRKGERGGRAQKLLERASLQEKAEEARLLYVAVTRARDRLVVSGPTEKPRGFSTWLGIGLEDAREAHELDEPLFDDGQTEPTDGPAARGRDARAGRGESGESERRRASAPDAGTGTGRQIDVFGFDDEREDATGQFNLFTADAVARVFATEEPAIAGHIEPTHRPMMIIRHIEPIQESLRAPRLSLAWLDGIVSGESPPLVRPIRTPALRFTTSATEQMMREERPREWELRYRHGVEPTWRFAPDPERDGALSPILRGTLIHGVLERIEEDMEIGRVLGETIAGIDAPELEELLAPGTTYREALEEEIGRVVRGEEWRWYLVGKPFRELRFVHLTAARTWRLGAFDLHRPALPGAVDPSPDAWTWVVDFKTHQIDADAADAKAREYRIQAGVYREAAEALGGVEQTGLGSGVRIAFHFTHPNVAVET
jgi:ATP-dependent exoDNAse (exonuclease V) beta subunit